GVADGDLEATDLRPQVLGDGQAGRVVGCTVDAETTGQLLQRLRHLAVRHRQVPVRVERGDVLVDTETHDCPPWLGSSTGPSVDRLQGVYRRASKGLEKSSDRHSVG